MFHDETDGVADVLVVGLPAPLHLGRGGMLLVLDVLQRVLHQVTHRAVLGGVQRLDVLQDVQNLPRPTEQAPT